MGTYKKLTNESFDKLDKDKIIFMMYRLNKTSDEVYFYIRKDKEGDIDYQNINFYTLFDVFFNYAFAILSTASLDKDTIFNFKKLDLLSWMMNSAFNELSKNVNFEEIKLIQYEDLSFKKHFNEFTEYIICTSIDKEYKDYIADMSLSIFDSDSTFIKILIYALSGKMFLEENEPESSYLASSISNFFIKLMTFYEKTESFEQSLKEIEKVRKKLIQQQEQEERNKND